MTIANTYPRRKGDQRHDPVRLIDPFPPVLNHMLEPIAHHLRGVDEVEDRVPDGAGVQVRPGMPTLLP